MEFTGERYVPKADSPEISYEHWHRYFYASRLVESKVVLDIACGEGYGSYLLSQHAKEVVGIDIDQEAVAHATRTYARDNLEFRVGNAGSIPVEGEGVFDVIVSFETIEHFPEDIQQAFLKEVKRLLRPDGLFIVSTPDKETYSDKRNYKNEFHEKEFYIDEFEEFLGKYFKNLKLLGQRIYPVSYIWDTSTKASRLSECHLEFTSEGFRFTKNEKSMLYVLAIASDSDLDNPEASILVDLSEKIITDRNRQISDLVGEVGERQLQLQDLERANAEKDEHITTLDREILKKNAAIQEMDAHIQSLEKGMKERNARIAGLETDVREKDARIEELEEAVRQRDSVISDKQNTLDQIYSSNGWKVLLFYYKVRDKLLPQNTKRRLFVRMMFNALMKPKSILASLSPRNIKQFFYYLRTADPSVLEEKFARKISEVSTETPAHLISVQTDDNMTVDQVEDLAFPALEEPLVSIVIPVWNKWIYTYHCLKSILEVTSDIPYEVVIVDNASTDETPLLLGKVKNIQVISNDENKGFVEACNSGAEVSRGTYVLFLNNDTQVTEGWLSSMVELIESDETIGAVGAKLIYPDGRLQEAGGIVWNDPDNLAWNYGRFDDPNKWEYNYVKEVDYCSGACLMMPKELFMKVGLFSMEYAPAYCEDTDLAFSIRKHGYRLMYQPKAEIIHFEGVTAGTDTSQGLKRFQVVNQETFFNKWQSELKGHHLPNGKDVFLARDRSQDKKVLLFVDHYVPTWDKDAGSLTTYMYLKLLVEMGFKIVFVPDNFCNIEPYTSVLQQLGIEVLYGRMNFEDWLKRNGKYIHYVWLARPHISIKYIDKIQRHTQAKVAYYTHDLHYIREMRRYELEKKKCILHEADRYKEMEFNIFNKTDVILTPSDKEVEILKSEFPNKEIMNIPGYFYDEIQQSNLLDSHFSERKNLLFVGGFLHTPNIDAVEYFVDEIYPHIRKALPDIKFYVVGSNPPESIKKLEDKNIIVTGYVEDLTEYYQVARVFVAPLRYGAGVKGKIVSSMQHGVPVITTSVGNEGLNLIDGEHCLIADAPVDFATKLIELYSDEALWKKLALNALDFLEEHFSKAAARDCMARVYGGNSNG